MFLSVVARKFSKNCCASCVLRSTLSSFTSFHVGLHLSHQRGFHHTGDHSHPSCTLYLCSYLRSLINASTVGRHKTTFFSFCMEGSSGNLFLRTRSMYSLYFLLNVSKTRRNSSSNSFPNACKNSASAREQSSVASATSFLASSAPMSPLLLNLLIQSSAVCVAIFAHSFSFSLAAGDSLYSHESSCF